MGPGGQNNHPVFYFALLHIRPDHDFGGKVAFKARITHHQRIGDHLNLLMGGDPGNQVAKVFPDIGALNGGRQSIGQSAQLGLFFNQDHFIALIGQAQSGIQAGNPAADHQAFLNHRDFLFLQRVQCRCPGHRHSYQIAGFFSGGFRSFRVHPGILVADIGHLKQVFV